MSKRKDGDDGLKFYLQWVDERVCALGDYVSVKSLAKIVIEYADFNAFEKEIVQRSDIGCQWKRTGNRNAAFTLSYGTFEIGHSYETDEARDNDDDNRIPCCWNEELFPCPRIGNIFHCSAVRFKGVHLFVVPFACSYEQLLAFEEIHDPTNAGIRSDPARFSYVAAFWNKYANTKPVGETVHPITYNGIVGKDVYKLLEKRFVQLRGASWWYLPSDCFSVCS